METNQVLVQDVEVVALASDEGAVFELPSGHRAKVPQKRIQWCRIEQPPGDVVPALAVFACDVGW
jgi:hypothetical protein